MKKVDISESPNEIIENDEDKDKGYSKIPIDQINLNTEPISIINDFNYSYLDNNIKSYIKVFLGFVIFVIFLLLISILSGHFHYEKPEISGAILVDGIPCIRLQIRPDLQPHKAALGVFNTAQILPADVFSHIEYIGFTDTVETVLRIFVFHDFAKAFKGVPVLRHRLDVITHVVSHLRVPFPFVIGVCLIRTRPYRRVLSVDCSVPSRLLLVYSRRTVGTGGACARRAAPDALVGAMSVAVLPCRRERTRRSVRCRSTPFAVLLVIYMLMLHGWTVSAGMPIAMIAAVTTC